MTVSDVHISHLAMSSCATITSAIVTASSTNQMFQYLTGAWCPASWPGSATRPGGAGVGGAWSITLGSRSDQVDEGEDEDPDQVDEVRSEERRVGKECRSGWSPDD